MASIAPELPRPITRYLGRFSLRRRVQRLVRAAGLTALFTIVWAIAWCLIDRAIALPATMRMMTLALNVAVAGGLIGRAIALLLARRDWIHLAAEAERREPAWGERLGTVVSRTLGPVVFTGSTQLLGALSDAVTHEADRRGGAHLLRWTPALRPWLAACFFAAAGALLFLSPTLDMPRLVHRYATPTAAVAPAATTRLFVSPGDMQIPAGESLRVRASAERLDEGSLTLHVRTRDGETIDQPMASNSEGQFEARITNIEDDANYFVTGGDARSDSFHIDVLRRPAVTTFDLSLTYPAYTGLPFRRQRVATGTIEAPVGTQVIVAFHSTEPLATATMAVGAVILPTTPTAQPNVRQARLTITDDRRFTLRMTSVAGVEGVFRGGVIRAIADRPPVAVLASASVNQSQPDEKIAIGYQSTDDFGLSKIDAEIFQGDQKSRAIAVPIKGDPREQHGIFTVDLKLLQIQADQVTAIRLRVEDRSGQFALSPEWRLDPVDVQSPAIAEPLIREPTSQPATEPAIPLDPPGYGPSIKAYFQAISGEK